MFADVHMWVLTKAILIGKKKKRGITVSIKWSAFQESSSVLQAQDHRTRLSVGASSRSLLWTLFYCSSEMKVGGPLPSRALKYPSCMKNCSKITHRLRYKPYYFAQLGLPAFPWLWFWDSFCVWVHVCVRERGVQNKQVPPSLSHFAAKLFKG